MFALILLIIGRVAALPIQPRQNDTDCPPLELIWARGTFETPGIGAGGEPVLETLQQLVPG